MTPDDRDVPDLNARYRTLLMLWFAICVSVLMLLLIVSLTAVASIENRNLSLALNCGGVVPFAASLLLKQRVLARSIEEQRLDLVQNAFVLSFAMCEAAALLAVMDHFITGSRLYYVGFVIAGLGLLLNFPRKEHLMDASSYGHP
jgi:hypothetical protein